MKNCAFFLLILVFSSFSAPTKIISISGKITNTANAKISIKGESFEKEIKLNADGTFAASITISYEGIYSLETGKNTIPLYLSKGTKLSLTANDNTFLSSIKYSGNGSVENQYIVQKTAITSLNPDKELYKLDEIDFLNTVKEIKKSITALYEKTKFSNSYFKDREARNIHYLEQKQLFYFKNYREYFTGLKRINLSDKYPEFDTEIDLDNDSDFLFSNDYKEIVQFKFYDNVKNDGVGYSVSAKDAIPKLKALKSQSIKNRIIQNSIYDVAIENADFEKIYNEFISITDDPKLVEKLTISYNNAKAVEKGTPSPKFDYENQKGGKTSLESLKGNYVFIDVWATWCGPCLQEVPFLEKIEKQYKGKNIRFVSISLDSMENHEKWTNMVNNKNMGGIQLLADNEFESEFIKAYGINAIPRFILIDPNGNILNSQAPPPSDTKLIELFNELKI